MHLKHLPARVCPACHQADMVLGAGDAYARRSAACCAARDDGWGAAPIFQQGAGQQLAHVQARLLPPAKPEGFGRILAWSVLGGLGVWFFFVTVALSASGGALPLSLEIVLGPLLLAMGLLVRMVGRSSYLGEFWGYLIARQLWQRTWYCSRCEQVFLLPRSTGTRAR